MQRAPDVNYTSIEWQKAGMQNQWFIFLFQWLVSKAFYSKIQSTTMSDPWHNYE